MSGERQTGPEGRYSNERYRDDERVRRSEYGYPYDADTGRADHANLCLALAAGALVGTLGATWYARRRAEEDRWRRPPDSAPAHASRLRRDEARPLAGRTVTIDKPRTEVYAYWRDFANLASFMVHEIRLQSRSP